MNLVEELLKKGYAVSPNNIHALPGKLMYASRAGLPAFPIGHEVQVESDRIRIFTLKFFGEQYSPRSYWDTVTVAVFDSVEAFLTSCPSAAEPGLPAFSNCQD
jgi:hypothetical protein